VAELQVFVLHCMPLHDSLLADGWVKDFKIPIPHPESGEEDDPSGCTLRLWYHHQDAFEDTPRRLVIEWTADGGDYRVLAEATDVEFERGWSAMRLVLSAGEAPQTAAAMLRNWPTHCPPPSRATLHRWLARGVERQWLCCEASSRRNAPYCYWLPQAEETGG
jgi:hypothetical protein